MLTAPGVTQTWNARGELTSRTTTSKIDYAYDALGRRAGVDRAGVKTSFLYDGLETIRETTGTTAVDLLSGAGLDDVLARTTGTTAPQSLLTDANGSVIGELSSDGALARWSYAPFGQATKSGAASTNRRLAWGREDDGNGLVYLRGRYLDPASGRFVSEDPIGAAAAAPTSTAGRATTRSPSATPSGSSDSATSAWPSPDTATRPPTASPPRSARPSESTAEPTTTAPGTKAAEPSATPGPSASDASKARRGARAASDEASARQGRAGRERRAQGRPASIAPGRCTAICLPIPLRVGDVTHSRNWLLICLRAFVVGQMSRPISVSTVPIGRGLKRSAVFCDKSGGS